MCLRDRCSFFGNIRDDYAPIFKAAGKKREGGRGLKRGGQKGTVGKELETGGLCCPAMPGSISYHGNVSL